jgi:hypothetical protein
MPHGFVQYDPRRRSMRSARGGVSTPPALTGLRESRQGQGSAAARFARRWWLTRSQ